MILLLLPLLLFLLQIPLAQPTPCPTTCSNLTNVAFPFGTARGCGLPSFQLDCPDNQPATWHTDFGDVFLLQIIENNSSSGHGSALVKKQSMANCSSLEKPQNVWPNPDLFDVTNNSYLLLDCQISHEESHWIDLGVQRDSQHCRLLQETCSTLSQSRCIEVVDFNILPTVVAEFNCSTYTTIPGVSSLSQVVSSLSFDMNLSWKNLSYDVQDCARCMETTGTCGYDTKDVSKFYCLCGQNVTSNGTACNSMPEGSTKCKSGLCLPAMKAILAIGTIIASAMAGSIAIYFCTIRKIGKFKAKARIAKSEDSNELIQIFANQMGPLPTKLFTYKELQEATKYFSQNRMIGDGGFGAVYEGRLYDGRKVAIKKLFHENHRRLEQFFNEVRILSCLEHPNLVKLLGFCLEDKDLLLLVYECISNGTLADHLHSDGGKGLLWETRLNIALETAQALSYLHYSVNPPIIHRDVKPSNILLDERFHAKVADFGLSRLVPFGATHVSTVPQGTPGYLDPDYYQSCQLTEKSDVYSFGVVLLEIVSAKLPVDLSRNTKEITLANFAIVKIQNGELDEFVDSNLEISIHPRIREMAIRVAELALQCLSEKKNDRPTMKQVVEELAIIREYGYGDSRGTTDAGDHRKSCKMKSNATSLQSIYPSSTSRLPTMTPVTYSRQMNMGTY